jgi:hypothetical protein
LIDYFFSLRLSSAGRSVMGFTNFFWQHRNQIISKGFKMSVGVKYEEDLVARIRDLIDGYPKNSILKEYLQNADDSGATELVVTFDKRNHSDLVGTKFEIASGASLLLYNNATFIEKDFDSIVKISAQGKVGDANSTGRFGQGFSSSFSISDQPSFVSGGRAYWFDVLKNSVSKDKPESIQRWSVEREKGEISHWLDTFSINDEEPGTVFRLPLRNDETANQSEISHEIFKYEDFLSWCDEWQYNSSGLLFLRHVQKLVLQEITEDNAKIIHMEICTKNSEEIQKYNNKIQDEFSSNLLSICRGWKESRETLPFFAYKHHFSIMSFDRNENKNHNVEESWAVVNGLFRGEEDCLIDQAIEVLNISPNHRKVLPWAGVAISLDEKGAVKKQQKYNYHTFLPLPIKSNHRVHIHGWFDLNPKRTEITFSGSGDDKDKLIEWNRLLFRDGVGISWAYLIEFIRKNCDPQKYYSLWPKSHDDEFDEYILEGFYKKITEVECFRTKHKQDTRWNSPKDKIYYIENQSDKKIFNAFKEHFSIISPKPTVNIIEGLNGVGAELEEITPSFIRDYLNIESAKIDFPLELENVPIRMLSKKDWLIQILIFCAEADEDKDYTYLEGLPFELTLDNKLNRLGNNKLLDDNPKLPIFKNDRSIFLHSDIIKIMTGAIELPSSWFEPSLINYLSVLLEHIDNYDRKNKQWLRSLISMIVRADESELSEAIDKIRELEIVCQYDGKFAHLKSSSNSPVLIPKEEIPNVEYLLEIGMELVHPEYIEIYKPLLKLNEYGLITELNSHSLVKHILYIDEVEYGFFEDKDTREYLIDLIAQDISWFDDIDDKESGWLNDVPFIATESDNIYARSEELKKLFLPAGFKPPKHIHKIKGEYEIINVVDEKQHALYKKMGFDEQNPTNYLTQIIIPFIEASPSLDDIENIVKWLCNNWNEITKDIDEDETKELLSKLSRSKIVPDAVGNLNSAQNYYHPDFYTDLPRILQHGEYLPLSIEDKETQENWLDLLSQLGVKTNIIPSHIVETVRIIVENDSDNDAIDLLKYISNHFKLFDEMKYNDKNIFDYLSSFVWMPVDKNVDRFLSPETEYTKLRKPADIIIEKDHKIAGGAHYTLSKKIGLGKISENGGFAERYIAEKLGLLVKLPNDSIFDSFRRLRSIESSPLIEKTIQEYSKEFYRYLGRAGISSVSIPKDIKDKSIFIKGHWISSSKVFQTPIDLTGVFNWDDLIAKDGKESKLADGLMKLEVRDRPDDEYLVNYLRDLPRSQKLEKQQLKDSKAILRALQDKCEELDIDNIPLLSRSNQLHEYDALFINDLPAYEKSKKRNDQLEFCQQQYEKLAIHCDVVSLSENLTAVLDYDNSIEADGEDNIWDKYLRSDVFKSAILRILYHNSKISEDEVKQETLSDILPAQVVLMKEMVIRYAANEVWIYDDLDASNFKSMEDSALYQLSMDDIEDMYQSIAEYISDTASLDRDSCFLIQRIIRMRGEDIEQVHNHLDKKNIKALPKEIVTIDEYSLFGDQDTIEETDEDAHDSFDEDPHDSFDEDAHDSFDEDDHGSTLGNDKQISGGTCEDIPPPIEPKTPSDNRNPGKSNSSGGNEPIKPRMVQGSRNNRGESFSDRTKTPLAKREKLSLKPSADIVSSNDRKPVYVGKNKELEDTGEPRENKRRATEIGNKGEKYVLDRSTKYLISKTNEFRKAETNNKGYDIEEIDSNGKIIRYIEVKTLTGRWGEGGVAVTGSQIEFAQYIDNWWLFVVENINTDNTKVHVFENPVQQANQFMFDHSWKHISETAKSDKPLPPQTGDKYMLSDGTYEITSVEPAGKRFYKVSLEEVQTGKKIIKKFDDSWEKC